jgi:2-oxoglutarate dehydrogenase E2 component (dihydrolipoamide succinyltransferase)
MAKFELVMPKMGESIIEATILNWVKKEGDQVEVDDTIVEIATDKVDSEVPSPVAGTIEKILFEPDETVEIGKVIAIINTEGEEAEASPATGDSKTTENGQAPGEQDKEPKPQEEPRRQPATAQTGGTTIESGSGSRFYSPLVRNIAETENISLDELEQIPGTGAKGRVTKKDILAYVENRTGAPTQQPKTPAQPQTTTTQQPQVTATNGQSGKSVGGDVEIVEMDRMRRMIADHMVRSKQTSPHVTSFVEVDVTNIVKWRSRNKAKFMERYGEKITFTPFFIEAVAKAIKDFPNINMSVDGNNLIIKKNINIGMAAAMNNGNLIVPVIKNADFLNLAGLAKQVNDLASRARDNKLKPDEIQGGTFTLTNVGTFGNVMGTPIINQPQVAIIATGAIRKKPAVVETEHGDLIAVRHMMFLSHSYDHRVVDGYLGGSFVQRVGQYLEAFDPDREV